MYPTESFVWSLSYIKDWTDNRYDSIRQPRSRIRRAATPTDPTATPADGPDDHAGWRYAVTRLAIVAATAAALAMSAAACGGGDEPEPMNACGFTDGEPNNDADHATVADMGAMFTGCLASGDTDYLSIQSPDDATGGYVRRRSVEASGTVRVTVYDDTGKTEIGSVVADAPGAPVSFYWASGAAQKTRIAVRDEAGGGAAYTYQLTTSYTAIADPFEPNDTMDTAAWVPDGGQMSAYLFAGAGNDATAYDDYYRFAAQPGAHGDPARRRPQQPGRARVRVPDRRQRGRPCLVGRAWGGADTESAGGGDRRGLLRPRSLWDAAPAEVGRGHGAARQLHAGLQAFGLAALDPPSTRISGVSGAGNEPAQRGEDTSTARWLFVTRRLGALGIGVALALAACQGPEEFFRGILDGGVGLPPRAAGGAGPAWAGPAAGRAA